MLQHRPAVRNVPAAPGGENAPPRREPWARAGNQQLSPPRAPSQIQVCSRRVGEGTGLHCDRFFGENSTCRQTDFDGVPNDNPDDLGYGFITFDNIMLGFLTVRPLPHERAAV